MADMQFDNRINHFRRENDGHNNERTEDRARIQVFSVWRAELYADIKPAWLSRQYCSGNDLLHTINSSVLNGFCNMLCVQTVRIIEIGNGASDLENAISCPRRQT